MYFTIDRFEGDIAVCENRDTREMINISKKKLPRGAKEGYIIKPKGNKYIIDYKKTKEIKNRIKEKLNNIKEKSK